MIVDRDGGRSPGELRGEKAVGRVEAPLIHLGPWEPRRLRRREGRRLATEAPAFLAPVVAEVVMKRVDVAPALLAEVVREIGVAPPVARGALGVRVLALGVARARAIELPLAPSSSDAFLVGCAIDGVRVIDSVQAPSPGAIFEEADGERHVAHRRRPQVHFQVHRRPGRASPATERLRASHFHSSNLYK